MKKEDRRIQKTKAAISAALFDLLEEKDFDQISINDIADRANVNRGTIYFHYADKFDLLDKIIEDRLEDLRAVCSPIHWDSTEKELIAVFRNKAYIHRSETSLSSQKGKQSEKHVGLHSEEHPVS